jgi:protein-S-isoprenylcysteine O-methyltransferase Ste14
MKSKLLVFSQFFIIFLMILPLGIPSQTVVYGLLVMSLGGVVGFLALRKNKLGNFNIRPDIREDCTLIKTGIYAYIRHPMYSSVLVTMLGIVVIYPMKYEYVLYGVLVMTLLIKLFYEESLWKCESEEYILYTKKTKRLIPFLF